jgi:hypothetical protein
VDVVQIPANLKPGKWVLGWRWVCVIGYYCELTQQHANYQLFDVCRWDCEESTQVK